MGNASTDFFTGGVKPAQFPQLGATASGKILDMVQTQQTTPQGELKTWQDGSPAMQLVITIQTTERDDADDDGKRTLYVKGQMKAVFGDALKRGAVKQLDIGGTVTVTYVADGERTNPAFSPPKQYAVQYVPPNASAGFLGGGNGVATATAEPVPAGVSAEVWATLSPEAKAAFANINAK
jgi:hypothetical protein